MVGGPPVPQLKACEVAFLNISSDDTMSTTAKVGGKVARLGHDGNDTSSTPSEEGEVNKSPPQSTRSGTSEAPPLPAEAIPPLPHEVPPGQDDGWDPVWDETTQAYYFYNRFTQTSQWANPRVPNAAEQPAAPGVANHDRIPEHAPGTEAPPPRQQDQKDQQNHDYGGYNPAIHGDYDPMASYALPPAETSLDPSDPSAQASADPSKIYTATGTFNRFTGKWQANDINPDNHNDENKSRRQMSAFFDVDAAANSHQGKSLKAERAGKKLSKQELRAFKEKRKERKEEKRRAWLRD